MQNWFPTLNDSLASEGLVDVWPVGLNIRYGETAQCAVDGLYMTVYRDEQGRYERVISYATKCDNFQKVFGGES